MRPSIQDLPPRRLLEVWGVTRVGRVTGLDRAGFEVACAVRPRGHVLQVSNGKARTFGQAARAALSEAAELEASETPDPTELRWASSEQMRRRFGGRAVWSIEPWLMREGELTGSERDALVLAWVQGRSLYTGDPLWIPAATVYCPPPGRLGLAPVPVRWTSNGLAAHPVRTRAVAHALLELAERDGLARALPNGWTRGGLRGALLDPGAHPRAHGGAPWIARRLDPLRAQGFETHLFLWPRGAPGGLPLPLAAALLFDDDDAPIPLTAGYACSPHAGQALESALLEAAQSRLTDIHGAREDVRPMEARSEAKRLRGWCRKAKAKPMNRFSEKTPVTGLSNLIQAFARAGHRDLAVVDLAVDRPGLHVVRVLSPTALLSELL